MGGREARGRVVAELSRREFIGRASAVGVGMLVAGALPVARAHALLGVPAPIDPDPTLQAFADTMIPGRKAIRTDLGDEIHPQGDRRRATPSPGAVEADALLLFHDPLIGFDVLEPAFLADLEARSLLRARPVPRPRLRRARRGAASTGSTLSNPTASRLGGGRGGARSPRSCARPPSTNATIDTASGYQVMGYPGIGAERLRATTRYRRKLARERTDDGQPAVMAERVDVCIVGSGLRRLDLRLPARRAVPRRRARPPSILVLERGRRHKHTDFRQSMDIEHLSRHLRAGPGRRARRS